MHDDNPILAVPTLVPRLRQGVDDHRESFTVFLEQNHKDLAAEVLGALRLAQEIRFQDFMLASREVATHYKWFLGADHGGAWTVWLHQYKGGPQITPQYANIPHNHRYSFVSLILLGGYDNVLYDIRARGTTAHMCDQRTLRAGQTLSLDHREVHSLTKIIPGTVTLFVQGRIQKDSSLSFGPDGAVQRHPSLESVFDQLRVDLQHL